MIFREAQILDIEQMHAVRMSVKENILPDAAMISAKQYQEYIIDFGKGWLCEIDKYVVGFAIVDLKNNNVWALFVRPDYEKKSIGKKLQDIMLNWYFSKTKQTIWLGTSPNTRAEIFYRTYGWRETGKRPNGEIRFELTHENWEKLQ